MEGQASKQAAGEHDRYSIRAVDRALDVLMVFTQGPRERSISEIAMDTGLGKATTHRLVRTLVARNFLERLSNDRFALGKMLPTLGMHVIESWTLRSLIMPTLRDLVDETGETALCSVLDGREVLTVASVAGAHRLRVNIVPGERAPASLTADGKVLLASLPRERAISLAILEAPEGPGEQQAWRRRLLRELTAIARSDVGYDLGIISESLRTVAVPLRDEHQRVIGAIGISGPTPRLTKKRLAEIASTLKAARPSIPSSPRIDTTLESTHDNEDHRNAVKERDDYGIAS